VLQLNFYVVKSVCSNILFNYDFFFELELINLQCKTNVSTSSMPKPINENPYRVLGIKANATAPEKQASKNSISAYLRIGKSPSLLFDSVKNLSSINRTESMIEIASNQILDDNDKIINSIFWFITGGLTDELTLNKIIDGEDTDNALQIFKFAAKSEQDNISKYSSAINYSTVEILNYNSLKDEDLLREAILCKYDICENRAALNLIGSKLQVQESNIDYKGISSEVLLRLKQILREFFPLEEEFAIINRFFPNRKEVIEQGAESIQKKINVLINESSEKRLKALKANNPAKVIDNCVSYGNELFRESKKFLSQIKTIYGAAAIQTQNAYESVFDEINHCVINSYNQFQSEMSGALERKEREKFRSLITKAGVNVFESSVRLLENSLNFSQDVNFTIKSTMKTNLDGIQEFQKFWKEKYNKLESGSEGGGTADGCLGEGVGCLGSALINLVLRIGLILLIGALVSQC
jgi:hypothetical protein